MTMLFKDENTDYAPVFYIPPVGTTIPIVTNAASHKNQSITKTALYYLVTPVDIQVGISGNATSSDMTILAASCPITVGLNKGETLSVYDASAGGNTVKITPI